MARFEPQQLDERPDDEDPRLLAAVQEYLAALEAGQPLTRHALAQRFPDLQDALVPYLDALDLVHGAAPLLDHWPPAASAATLGSVAQDNELRAEPLGDFRIVRELGRGGMGVVYEAVQRSLGRRVALKVLPFAAALDARQLQRFKNEAQAAAQLHHQNIVPVYAVGMDRGVHFYAMQLIEGQNLARVVGDLRKPAAESPPPSAATPAATPVRELHADTAPARETRDTQWSAAFTSQRTARVGDYFRSVARLAAQAAEALDYAHNQGVVHRDVKPANLLVDARGNLWITDFGLAQFHADAGLTQTGDLLGTLRYMSPEQASGQVSLLDHRTDVYSLGATLFELLTLRPIFDGADRPTLLHQILHDEPRPPRALDRTIPPELETIVLKALGKSPSERYATAREFADDLWRFLRHEPIRARRATWLQRGRKWLRRHPAVPIAGAVLLVVVAVGAIASAWVIRGEQEKTRLAYQRERDRAQQAEERFQLARRSVDDMIRISEEELADKPHLEGLRRRLLESALVYYQEFIDLREDEPAAVEELQETKQHVERIMADLAVLQGLWRLQLLNHPWVLDNLHLSSEQRRDVLAFNRQMDERRASEMAEFGELPREECGRRFMQMARAHDEGVRRILPDEQQMRLRSIALRLQGTMAFQDPEVSAELELTPEQRERIRTIERTRFLHGHGPGRGPGGPGGPGGRGPEHFAGERPPGKPDRGPRLGPAEELALAMVEIREVLNDEQARRWDELLGPPLEGEIPWLFPGPPGPPDPPRRP